MQDHDVRNIKGDRIGLLIQALLAEILYLMLQLRKENALLVYLVDLQKHGPKGA